MKTVRSYNEFLSFMKTGGPDIGPHNMKPIPILLIQPYVLRSLMDDYPIGQVIDYFNHRTGKDMVFFLPGYTHRPVHDDEIEFQDSSDCNNKDERAFIYRDYYSQVRQQLLFRYKDFASFINTFETIAEGFQYYGGTELLLPSSIYNDKAESWDLDFHTLSKHRYDLSKLVFANSGNLHYSLRIIVHFIEDVYHFLLDYDAERFYDLVDHAYENAIRRIGMR